jgi:hypothetical protein
MNALSSGLSIPADVLSPFGASGVGKHPLSCCIDDLLHVVPGLRPDTFLDAGGLKHLQ